MQDSISSGDPPNKINSSNAPAVLSKTFSTTKNHASHYTQHGSLKSTIFHHPSSTSLMRTAIMTRMRSISLERTLWVAVVIFVVFTVATATVSAQEQCSFCGPDNPFSLESWSRSGNDMDCPTLYDSLGENLLEGSEDCKQVQLLSFQTGCCDSNSVPPTVCSVCPDGGSFLNDVEIPSAGRAELKCADLTNDTSFLDYMEHRGDCSDTFLQRSAAWCGCAGTSIQCSLCPDGSKPPNPSKTEDVLYGWDCNVFEYIFALLSEAECHSAAEILEFDAAAFCCPHVAQSPNICQFCPDGTSIGDPDKIISSDYGPMKCGDIQESIELIPTEKSCEFTKSKFKTHLCCTSSGAVAFQWAMGWMWLGTAFFIHAQVLMG
jgi:hypothetical protein